MESKILRFNAAVVRFLTALKQAAAFFRLMLHLNVFYLLVQVLLLGLVVRMHINREVECLGVRCTCDTWEFACWGVAPVSTPALLFVVVLLSYVAHSLFVHWG